MPLDKLTLKAQEVLQEGQKLATQRRHQYLDAAHLFAALLNVEEQIVPEALEKAGVTAAKARETAEAGLSHQGVDTGSNVQLTANQRFREILAKVEDEAKALGDEYVSTEHLLLALLAVDEDLAKKLGVTRDRVSYDADWAGRDFVIVDTSPVLPVSDALLIGQYVDGAVCAILRDVSRLPRVQAAYSRLTALNIRVLGAVFAGVSGTSYGSHYQYHGYAYSGAFAGRTGPADETSAAG